MSLEKWHHQEKYFKVFGHEQKCEPLVFELGSLRQEQGHERKEGLGILFQRPGCPPWRGLTLQLAKWYSQDSI